MEEETKSDVQNEPANQPAETVTDVQNEPQPSITIQKSEIQADTADIADFTLKLASVSIVCFDGGSGSIYNSANDGKPKQYLHKFV